MKNLLQAGRVMAMDLASTILFLVVYLSTDSLFISVGLGMALGRGADRLGSTSASSRSAACSS